MKKRQEKPYAAQVAKMSKKRLAEEIGRLISLGTAEDTAERLSACILEDDNRGGTCYPAGVALFNKAIGLRQIGPNEYDMRDR